MHSALLKIGEEEERVKKYETIKTLQKRVYKRLFKKC